MGTPISVQVLTAHKILRKAVVTAQSVRGSEEAEAPRVVTEGQPEGSAINIDAASKPIADARMTAEQEEEVKQRKVEAMMGEYPAELQRLLKDPETYLSQSPTTPRLSKRAACE